MYSPRQKLSIEDPSDADIHANTPSSINGTGSDVDSPNHSYALIETDPNELDRIIDLLRQFFPNTKIVECNNQSHSSHTIASQQQASIESNSSLHIPISSCENDINTDRLSSQTFKGKVKDYLQRRYLEQLDEHQSRKEIFTKCRSDDLNSFDLSSSNLKKPPMTLKAHSLDSSSFLLQHSVSDTNINSFQTENLNIIRSQSKRGFLQRGATIDMEDIPGANDEQLPLSNDTGKITFSIDRPDDDDEVEEEVPPERKSRPFRHSYSEQQTNKNDNHFLVPYRHSFEQEQERRTSSSFTRGGGHLPLTPYSASSDPGPYHSLWLNTPTSSPYGLFNFRFPQSQEQLVANAQGSIAQLSTLTKIICNDPCVFTPISPRFKTETHKCNTSPDSSSIPPCQICRQQFDSHQMYLTHYRTHLENSNEDDKTGILDLDINSHRPNDLRNYSCNICSKRFSRSDMLNRHLRLHTGIRPYRCTICNTHFSRSDHLSTHLRTHTGEKPYTCPQCSYTACRRDMITRHLKIHTKQRSERKNATSSFSSSNES